MQTNSTIQISVDRKFEGRPTGVKISLPPSKSLMLRYLVYAGLAKGRSVVKLCDPNLSEDIEDMIEVLRSLGVVVEIDNSSIVIFGSGGRLSELDACKIQVRLSGVSARFAVALAALRRGETLIDGYFSLRRRPIGEVAEAVRQLGVVVDGESLPLVVKSPGKDLLETGSIRVSGEISSQFITVMLGIGPCLPNGLQLDVGEVVVSRPYLEMSLAAMKSFGAAVEFDGAQRYKVAGLGYTAQEILCESDLSAASYFMALATALGVSLALPGVLEGSCQGDVVFAEICERLGAVICWTDDGLLISGPTEGRMNSIAGWLDFSNMPDVAPTFAALGPFIPGGVRIKGLGTLRVKECDRIRALEQEISKIGIEVRSGEDWLEIGEYNSQLHERGIITVATYDDHRMAMSFAVLGALLPNGIKIADPKVVGKTFPTFWQEFSRATGATICISV